MNVLPLTSFQKTSRTILWVLGACYVLYHFLSLDKTPYPWFDETFMVSISKDFLEHRTFIPQIAQTAFRNTERLIHGPVYFIITSIVFKIGGISIFTGRVIGLFSYFLFIWVGCKVLQRLNLSFIAQLVWIIGVLSDPRLFLTSHEGRMETLVIFLLLLSFYYLLNPLLNVKSILLSGLFFVLAVLSSPRIGFIVIPYGCYILYHTKNFYKGILWISPVVLVYSFWVYYAFGSVDNFVDCYTIHKSWEDMPTSSFMLNTNWYITINEKLLLGIAFFLGIATFFRQQTNPVKSSFGWFLVLAIIAYYLLVNNWGSYMAYSLVLLYLLIAYLSEGLLKYPWISLMLLSMLVFNLVFSGGKILLTIASWSNRSPEEAKVVFQKHVPKGAKVVGDPVLYYVALQSGNPYEYFEHYESLEQREKLQREVLDYEYLVVSDIEHERVKEALDYYIEKGNLKKIAAYKAPEPSALEKWIYKFKLLSEMEKPGYGFEVWKRNK